MMELGDLDPVAAGALRLVELLVGAPEEILGSIARGNLVGAERRDADRGAHRKTRLLAHGKKPAPEAF